MTDIVRIGEPFVSQATDTELNNYNFTLVAGTDRIAVISVSAETSINPSVEVSFGGVALTQAASISQTGGGNRLGTWLFYLLEADLPANGSQAVSVELVGFGASAETVSGISTYEHVRQQAPTTATDSESGATSVSVTLSKPALQMMVGAAAGAGPTPIDWSHDNTQLETYSEEASDFGGVGLEVISDSEITTPFTSTVLVSQKLTKAIMVFVDEPITDIHFATVIAATSTVSADMTRVKPFATALAATSEVTAVLARGKFFVTTVVATSTVAADLHRNRGYVTSLAVVSAVTTNVVREVSEQTTIAATSALTVQPIERLVGLATVVSSVATVTSIGLGGIDRLYATVINAQLSVSASFGNTFDENISSLTPGCYIELFEIDTTIIGGGDVFRFIPGGYDVAEVQWQGEEYTRFPIVIEGFEWNATSQAPTQPTLKLSNVNKFVLAAIITLGDIVGAKVTRWRTYAQYLDDGEQADANAHFPPDIYLVQQKTAHNKEIIEWTLSSALDLPGVMLPKRQVLRDETTGNVYAPGVSKVRFKGR